MGCVCKKVEVPVEGVDNIDIQNGDHNKNEDDQKLTGHDRKEDDKAEVQQTQATVADNHKEPVDLDRSTLSNTGKKRKKSK